ncbi:MAG TPA: amino acid adenylation domain-containing protein, partial [Herpetosiphonaceae bacterium]
MSNQSQWLAKTPSEKQELLAQIRQQQPDALDVFPLSFAQRRLWFLDQLLPRSVYTIPVAVQLTGPLDVTALATSLNHLVQRHETLRTTMMVVDGEPMQLIRSAFEIPLPIVSLTHIPAAEQAAHVQALSAEDVRQPFDLEQGPLVRARLFQLAPTEHVLLLLLHHSMCDGWSLGVLIREVAACYAAARAHHRPTLPPLPIQYADYAVWQHQWIQSSVAQKQLAYWRQQLAAAPPLLELPTDFPRPAAPTYRGGSHTFVIPPTIASALPDLSRQFGATPFMTLLALFEVLIYRYTGQHDLMIGTPIAGRRPVETEGLIGFFVNTLALRTDLRGNPTFGALLQRVRAVTLQAYAHQDLPFEQIVADVHPERSLHAVPLIQVFFALQNVPRPVSNLGDLTLRRFPIAIDTVQYDLILNMEEADSGLWGRFEYSADLFMPDTIARMAGHFQTLLMAIVKDPERPIGDLPLLTDAEEHRLLVEWNSTQAPFERACLHRLVEAQARRTPDVTAVIDHDQRVTYAELNRRANRLAHHLRQRGIDRGMRVGVALDRSVDLIVALLGILKAGGAYVPLDPLYPPERLAFMLEDAQAALLLTRQAHGSTLPDTGTPLVQLDADRDRIAQASADNPVHDDIPEQSAYVIYTSGSTGRPKGVDCHHAGVVNLLTDFTRRQPILPGDACSCWTSISFDPSVYEIWSALVAGGTLHLVPDSVRVDGAAFIAWLDRHQIRSAYIPPFLVQDLAAWLDRSTAPCSLRRLLVGVEPIPEALLALIAARVPGLQIINGYGPTEATICATLYPIQPGATANRYAPIGQPVHNTQIYVLDAALRPVPIGVPGEVYIGGGGLAHGYFNRPDLTAERFTPNPFSRHGHTLPGTRLYRTGDRARYLPDGNLIFLGRSDQQVKIRGFRVELEEIEAVIGQHPRVRENVVLAREAPSGEKWLVAYVVEQQSNEQRNTGTQEQGPGEAPEALNSQLETLHSDLRTYLQARLPDYMVPGACVVLDALPLTPSGKVDRGALPTPEAADRDRPLVAPRTPLEQRVASVWADVLRVESLSIHDRFFELGGHSLLATHLIARINAAFGVELPLRSIFEGPTIAELTRRIMTAQHAAAQRHAPPIAPVGRDQPLPLSFAQQRLWLLDQFEPESASYIIPIALRLTGSLDVAALQQSLDLIVQRHEALRTTFAIHQGEPVQVIAAALTLPLPVVDLGAETADPREQRAREIIVAAAQSPFDLERGPLLRTMLLRISDNEHMLVVTMHHIIADGWSAGVLVRELTTCYTAFVMGATPHLP